MIGALFLAAMIGWKGLEADSKIAGRTASEGYLQGKIVLVDCRDYSVESPDVKRLEQIWNSFKMKPFVLLGSHREGSLKRATARVKRAGVTFPVYAGAGLAENEPHAKTPTGFFYVMDASGTLVYFGRDINRATEMLVAAIAREAVPNDAKQFAKLLEFELTALPGKAINRYREFKKRFPKDAAAYSAKYKALASRREVIRLAKLETLSESVKDYDPKTRGGKRVSKARVKELIAEYSDLKDSADEAVVREVKSCLADLTWAMSTM